MKKYPFTVLVLLFLFTLNYSHAEEVQIPDSNSSADQTEHKKKSFVAPIIGYAISNTTGGTNSFVFGGRFGSALFSDSSGMFSLGLMIASASDSQTVSGIKITETLTPVLIELITRRAFGTGLYYGGRFGLGLYSAEFSSGSTSLSGTATPFSFGPVLGYEVPLGGANQEWNLLFDFTWLNFGKSTLDVQGTKLDLKSFNYFTLITGVQYQW